MVIPFSQEEDCDIYRAWDVVTTHDRNHSLHKSESEEPLWNRILMRNLADQRYVSLYEKRFEYEGCYKIQIENFYGHGKLGSVLILLSDCDSMDSGAFKRIRNVKIKTAQAQEHTPNLLTRKFCLGTNYTANNTYRADLNILLSSLSTTFTNNSTIPRYGYHNITIGASPDIVYGSLHFREDMAPSICSKCIQIATDEVMQDSGCPNKKAAIMFFNGCVLRYSNENYFSILSEEPSEVITYFDKDIIGDQVEYIEMVTRLLNDLVTEDVTNTSISPSLYATRSVNYTRFIKVYAMVQCTPDLTPSLCNRCLRLTIKRLPSDAQAARVLFPSCTFRFEYDPFYRNYMYTNQASPPPPTLNQSPWNTSNRNGKASSSKLVITIAIPLAIAILLSSIAVWGFRSHHRKKINNNYFGSDMDQQDIQCAEFDFNIISAATNNFSEDNKLGQGGFGPVYKGTLSTGREITVKRLSTNSSQDDQEFRNEVLLLAKLQHRNLVRIVHRDIKASNILLAEDMIPKFSDFGMAKIFEVDRSQADTSRVERTRGYMAPEYLHHGRFSVKADVFSFGFLVPEILSGKKIKSRYVPPTGDAQDLLIYEGSALEVLDSSFKENYSRNEVMRCIHVALLCVQDSIVDRPTMASVILMLNRSSMIFPPPTQTAYFMSDQAVEEAQSVNERGVECK
ncbi:cysteine-rich receptor-like protein kinase 25 [Papaver somniferum]|uniref:cysteine-rich receptor-like protein kinase 25 n=1 Tax=Papaver somniferum TaxID=3469 RepID=UPI000E6F57E9|nr:cysteine-rich receptor-like protein kinase 25 [Papaver somniferum]